MATLTAKDIKTGYYYTNKRNEVLYIVSLTLLPGNPGLTNAQVELQYRILKNNTWSEIKKYKYDVTRSLLSLSSKEPRMYCRRSPAARADSTAVLQQHHPPYRRQTTPSL